MDFVLCEHIEPFGQWESFCIPGGIYCAVSINRVFQFTGDQSGHTTLFSCSKEVWFPHFAWTQSMWPDGWEWERWRWKRSENGCYVVDLFQLRDFLDHNNQPNSELYPFTV